MITLTKELLHPKGHRQGFNKIQLHFLGLNWPPEKGWAKKLIGTEIMELDYQRFVRAGEIGVRAMEEEMRKDQARQFAPKASPLKPSPEMYQTVWIVFSDGTKAGFTGKAVAFGNDMRTIRDISFSTPKPLPPGHSFGEM